MGWYHFLEALSGAMTFFLATIIGSLAFLNPTWQLIIVTARIKNQEFLVIRLQKVLVVIVAICTIISFLLIKTHFALAELP